VSERIAALEQLLGVRLLDRLGRETVPTALGRLLYERASALLARREEISRELAGLLGEEGGAVALGASTLPGVVMLPGLLPRFLQRHPGTRITLRIADSREILGLVAAGDLELGLVGFKGEDPLLRLRPLWSDELVLAIPASHRWSGRRRVAFADLADEPLIMREEGSGTRRFLEAALETAGFDARVLKRVAELGSAAAIKQGIIAGLGLSFVSRRSVEIERRVGLLATVRVQGLSLERRVFLADDPRRSPSSAAEGLSEFLLETAKEKESGE